MQRPLARLNSTLVFPPVDNALDDPNGLLAIGGDLSSARLLLAYRSGIFPWYSPGDPILWWSPDPRCVFIPQTFKPSQRFARFLRHSDWQIKINSDFRRVITRCANIKRAGQRGTWITREMIEAYTRLHTEGHAHSIEVWQSETLIGGLYGVANGHVFFGESMFSECSNGSKTALTYLCAFLRQHDYALLDCQVPNPHLLSLGAQVMPRATFMPIVSAANNISRSTEIWQTHCLDRSLLRYFNSSQNE